MTDLLVQRLKAAKRELTALKTAHRRGLGLVKLYEKTIALTPPTQYLAYVIKLTIVFEPSSQAYPFIQLVPTVLSDTSAIDLGGIEYIDSGMSCIVSFEWIRSEPIVDRIDIVSSSPIKSIQQEWLE
ncbi:hypothetical protein IJ098_00500 [Candidatus Saccharibacteria bacterium]|nr:hypothetical protein [Candidatus Saccharibacteria bacterium]